jgi:hypothetical protein
VILVRQPDFGSTPIEHHRMQGRLNSRVPLAFEWNEGSERFRTDGYTVDVSSRGCLARVSQHFTIGQHLGSMNLANQNSFEVVLVWSRKIDGCSWELGLELQEPGLGFRGLEL